MREIFLLPPLIALGIGLSLNNARAVLEAIFNQTSAFVRTPKYGIEQRPATGAEAGAWRKSRYLPIKSLLPLVELGFAIYFTYFIYCAAVGGQYSTLPYLVLFQLGFCYVAFSSLTQWMPARWAPAVTRAARLSIYPHRLARRLLHFCRMDSAAARRFVQRFGLATAVAVLLSAWRNHAAARGDPQPGHHQRPRPKADGRQGGSHPGLLPDFHL